ncbi:MAG: gliding motility-associated C-terminal domain-containing protein [Crocinitomicaceae bacterium]|nr:gliding motility-associated C-terminal domain-containing protein [Crocinitomicaceae bacterium]
MKKKILFYSFIALISSATSFAQTQVVVDSPEYNQRKIAGTLDGVQVIQNPNQSITLANPITNPDPNATITPKSGACDCYVTPDATYIVALPPGDDGSSSLITIPFNFSFYGQNYTSLYINNNGNVTFGNSLSGYSSNAFPSSGNKIVAPFWADVDTRNGNGQVVYKITPNAIYINWVAVGYYSSMGDKLNTFQLILSDGTDPAIPSGQNIAFCYQDMQWTTGAASSGVNGFGGTPATAGANKGDNILSFQLARFDHAGVDFNGALGAPSGISWLDDKSFYFNISNSTNIPPIANGVTACDTFRICALGDTADIPIIFFSPEAVQSTSITYTTTSPGTVTQIANVSGNTATIVLRAIGSLVGGGYHEVTVTATDNGTPVGVTTLSFVIFVDTANTTNWNPVLTPPGGCQTATLGVLNGPYDSYLWDNLTVFPTNVVTTPGYHGVTVSKNGCYKRVSANINIMPPVIADVRGAFGLCPGETSSTLYIADSLKFSSISWGLADPIRDAMYSNTFSGGSVITIHLVDSAGYCSKDTTLTLQQQLPLQLVPDFDKCVLTHQMVGNTGGSGHGNWTVYNSVATPTFSNSTVLNPNVTFPSFGAYHLVFADDYCDAIDTIHINLVEPPYFDFDSDFFACPFETETLVFKDSILIKEYHWGFPIAAQDTVFHISLYQGTYTASYEMFLGCTRDTTFTIASLPETILHNYGLVCGDTLTMNLHQGTPNGIWTIQTMPGSTPPVFGDITKLNTTIKITDYGDYVLVFKDECDNPKSMNIQFRPFPFFNLFDAEICVGETHTFVVPNQPFVPNYVWNTGLTGTSLQTSTAGTYTLVANNECGTFADSAVLGAFVCELEFPNVFTPDGDGTNDFWTSLDHPDGFNTFDLRIFNRWGNLMYSYDRVNGAWNGKTSSGAEATEGIYFYKLVSTTKNNKELNRQGFFHLIRK